MALLRTHKPVEILDVLRRDCGSLHLQHLCSQFTQVVTFTANQLLCWDLHITHQAATGGTLLCKGTTTLPNTTTFSDVQHGIDTFILLRTSVLLTPSLGIFALLRRPILDQWGTLHTLILCRITSRSKPKMSWPYRTRITILTFNPIKHRTFICTSLYILHLQ